MSLPRRGFLVLAGLAVAGCIVRPDELVLVPEALAPAPEIRIGLLTSAQRVTIDSDSGLVLIDLEEGELARVPALAAVVALPRGVGVTLEGGGAGIARRTIRLEPFPGGTLSVDGRSYRGALDLLRVGDRLQVVNRIDLEDYLLGVVGAELGRRAPDEYEALKAQAVAARTYALRNLGRSAAQGFDLAADVSAQAYAGTRFDDSLTVGAVVATRGEVLEMDGVLIDAFYSSTCGGRTEDGVAAFAGADRPYLRSVDDLAPDGTAWCAISPRFTWRETWSAAQLTAILQRTLTAERLPAARATDLRDLAAADRTRTGRLATLELRGRGGSTLVRGQAIRRVLAPAPGAWLRSTDFTIRVARSGSRIERVVLEGRGYGHGVGMCQWGAIGRARAGQDYATILTSYFPGTTLQRIY